MELSGRVVRVLPTASGVSQQGNQWQKQEFIFGYYENPSDIYERNIKLDLMNDRIGKYNLEANDEIKVRIALSCHEYPQGSGKYFNEIRTGDITILKKANGGAKEPAQAANGAQADNKPQAQTEAPTGGENAESGEQENDGLPF
jgi:hypothetical protein